MKLIFLHKTITSIALSALFTLFILPITESLWFSVEGLGGAALTYSYILKFLFAIALTFLIRFALHFIEKLATKDAFYKRWLINSLGYGVILGALLLLIFPGYWVWDELYVLSQSEVYAVHSWQHIFTQLQYIFSLYLIPSSTGITIIQLGFIAIVTGYVLAIIQTLTRNKWLWALAIIPFITLPVLLGNFYTLRLHVYGYVLLLLLLGVFLLYKNNRPATPQYARFIGFIVLLTLLAFWRSEGIIYLVTLPFLAYRLNILQFSTLKHVFKTVCIGIISVIIIVSGYLATSLTEESHYKLTATISPLSILVHEDLRGEKINEAWKQVGTVLNLDVLRQFPSYVEIPSVWRSQTQSVFQPDYEQHLDTYYKGLSYIILNNPDAFLNVKLKTFLATNSLDQQHVSTSEGWLTPYTLAKCDYMPDENCNRVGYFVESNRFNGTLNAELRKDTIYFLLQQNITAPHYGILRMITWNVIPTLAILTAILLHSLFTRRWLWSGIIILLFGHTALVFTSAPANYFMYYFPIYLTGSVLAVVYLVSILQKRRTNELNASTAAIIKPMKAPETKVLIAIPAYNCADQITRVLGDIDLKLQKRVAEVAVIDNGSTDDTIQRALDFKKTSKYKAKLHVYKNDNNYNLGGTHKVAFAKAEKEGFTHVIILHGDDQAKSSEANNLLDFAETNPQQTVLGSRFNKASRLHGYDRRRIFGNKVLNAIYSAFTLRKLEDLGSGLNLFYLEDLDKKTYLKFADKLTFNYELILDLVKRKVNFAYLPITWSEEDQVSNARNVTIFKTALSNVILWRIGKPTVNETRKKYTCKEVR